MQNYNIVNNTCSALACTSSGYVTGAGYSSGYVTGAGYSSWYVTDAGYDCVPPELLRSEPNGAIISNLFLINEFLIGFIGILGNLMTVATIVNAKKNHREEFRIFSYSSTPLLIHLAICDILYCAVGLPSFGVIFAKNYFPLPELWCRLVAMFRNITAYTDFLTLGLISVDLACFYTRGKCLITNANPYIVCCCLWVASFGLNSINVFNITGSFGYDAINGRCEAIPLWPDCSLARSGTPQYMEECKRMEGVAWYRRGVHGGQVIYLVGFWVPFFAILISTMIIWCQAYRKHLKELPASDTHEFHHMERTLILVFLSYCLFPLPLLVLEWSALWYPCMENKELVTWCAYNFYWWMYAINFIIYFTRNKRFRQAFNILVADFLPRKLKTYMERQDQNTGHSNSFVERVENIGRKST